MHYLQEQHPDQYEDEGLIGGHALGELHEAWEMELAAEFLEISSEEELEEFLGKLAKGVQSGAGRGSAPARHDSRRAARASQGPAQSPKRASQAPGPATRPARRTTPSAKPASQATARSAPPAKRAAARTTRTTQPARRTSRAGGPAAKPSLMTRSLKSVATNLLPFLGGKLADHFKTGSGDWVEAGLSTLAGALFDEFEGLTVEDRDFEIARRYVGFALEALQRALQAPPRVPEPVAVRIAVSESARNHVPALVPFVPQLLSPARSDGSGDSGRWSRHGSSIVIDSV